MVNVDSKANAASLIPVSSHQDEKEAHSAKSWKWQKPVKDGVTRRSRWLLQCVSKSFCK